MRAMILDRPRTPLRMSEIPIPIPNKGQILIQVIACGICRTDLHVVDGELTDPKLPLIPGHQIIGIVVSLGEEVANINIGQRIGVPWLAGTCGQCEFCLSGKENLCDQALYTGYQINGGFAEYCVANAKFCFPIPENYPSLQAAPLLCAGLIGYRSYSMAGTAKRIGFYGFGASAHILIQLARYEQREVYAFTRQDDIKAQSFAKSLGAFWTGSSEESPPNDLDAAIIFAPSGDLVPLALKAVKKGGKVICAGIHMSDIPSFPYSILWGERMVCSVANLTRKDGLKFLTIAPHIPIKTQVKSYPLEKVNEALNDLREGKFTGAAVIEIGCP